MKVPRWKSLSSTIKPFYGQCFSMEIAWLCAQFYTLVSNWCGWNSQIHSFERVSTYFCIYTCKNMCCDLLIQLKWHYKKIHSIAWATSVDIIWIIILHYHGNDCITIPGSHCVCTHRSKSGSKNRKHTYPSTWAVICWFNWHYKKDIPLH